MKKVRCAMCRFFRSVYGERREWCLRWDLPVGLWSTCGVGIPAPVQYRTLFDGGMDDAA